MRPIRVCIYGGTDLDGTPTSFIATLTHKLLHEMEAVIVTGGFHHSMEKPKAVSTDVAALQGAQRYAAETGKDLKDYYEAWIPDPELDHRPTVKTAVRMTGHERITVREMKGRTPLGRRLAMVAGVDIVVTISGKQHTEVVVEQALELGVPVLPIPDAGGDSRDLLSKYRRRIDASFAPGALDRSLQRVSQTIESDPEAAAGAVIDLLRTAKVGRCLVLLPYDPVHDRLYASTIEPAVARHMNPVRLDRLPKSEAIYTSFAEEIRTSSAVIADITELNANVMYEIGYSHGYGLTPLLYTRDEEQLEKLPVYFRNLNVKLVSENTSVDILIDEYLRSLKKTRRLH